MKKRINKPPVHVLDRGRDWESRNSGRRLGMLTIKEFDTIDVIYHCLGNRTTNAELSTRINENIETTSRLTYRMMVAGILDAEREVESDPLIYSVSDAGIGVWNTTINELVDQLEGE